MAISSQKKIIESFKSQFFHTLDAFSHGLTDRLTDSLRSNFNDSFHSIQDSLNNMQERFLVEGLMNGYNQEIYAWYDFDADCDD
jgi:hypothetical protein